MKKHIVRAMQTDRYGLDVPTKLSELENDLPLPPYFSGVAEVDVVSGAGVTDFPVAGLTTLANRGFVAPSGIVSLTVPETGLYLFTCNMFWKSTISSGSGVGRLTTTGTFQLRTLGPLLGAIDGAYLYDNKLGILTTDPGDIQVRLYHSYALPATAGDSISFSAESLSAPIDVTAVTQFTVAKIA